MNEAENNDGGHADIELVSRQTSLAGQRHTSK